MEGRNKMTKKIIKGERDGQEEVCEICGVVFEKHPRCAACGILVGPGHIETGLVSFMGHKIAVGCSPEEGLFRNWGEFCNGRQIQKIHLLEQEIESMLSSRPDGLRAR